MPSYQVSFTGGKFFPGGEVEVTMAESGCTSDVPPQEVASTLVGGPSFKADTTGSKVCAPRSPIIPLPKSQNRRHVTG